MPFVAFNVQTLKLSFREDNAMKTIKFILALIFVLFSNHSSFAGGNTSSGGDPEKVRREAIRLLIEDGGLKKAMLNYLNTLQISQIQEYKIKALFVEMMKDDSLKMDIQKSRYYISANCKGYDQEKTPASTSLGVSGSDICFNIEKLIQRFKNLTDEAMMVELAGLAFHEHVHHFQKAPSTHNNEELIKKHEQIENNANAVGGYILITAKYVQVPLLQWSLTENSSRDFSLIESLYNTIKAKEKAYLNVSTNDYKAYPGYQGQTDRGVIRLLPRDQFDGKLSVRGGGAKYSFSSLTHDHGNNVDIQFSTYNKTPEISVGFAGCDFGYILDLGDTDLNTVNELTQGMKYLWNFMPAELEPEIRPQQRESHNLKMDGYTYARSKEITIGNTYAIRSINFGDPSYGSDLLVAVKILRFDKDGSVILAWKKLKSFQVHECKSVNNY